MWHQLRIEHCARDHIDTLCDELLENGALSVTLTDKDNQPLLEPVPGMSPLWPEVIVQALYDDMAVALLAQVRITHDYPQAFCGVDTLEDQPWERLCRDSFTPLQISENFWVCPSWITPPFPAATNLILDPGLAFGTGTHPTTLLCLQWLAHTPLANQRVLDFGCGSGILALAACKRGAIAVQAVDIDPQALLATRNNAHNNGISDDTLHIGLPDAVNAPVDIILANILYTPLTQLKNTFEQLLLSGGRLVVSGLLADQVEPLLTLYEASSFVPQHTQYLDGWARIAFRYTPALPAKEQP